MGARGSGGHGRVGPAKKGAETSLVDLTDDCTAPGGLSDEAASYWSYYAGLQARRGMLTESSRDTLRSYCQVLVQRDRIEAELRTSPVLIVSTVVDGAGNEHPKVQANPLLAAQRQTEQTLHTLANDLALPPASAVRLPPRKAEGGDDVDDWGGVTGPRIKAVK